MTTKPKVSVIVPVYNGAEHLRETLDSIFNQTFKEFELIVVDDGSSDKSVDIIKSYGGRVVFIQHKRNLGAPSFTKNTGIKVAKGEYLAFSDHDDNWYPKKLEKQISILDKHPEVVANFTNGHIMESETSKNIAQRWNEIDELPEQQYCIERLLRQNFILSTTSAMIRSDIIRKIGGFDEKMLLADDFEMWFRLACAGKLSFLQEPLFQWRFHTQSLSHDEDRHLNDLIYFYEKAKKTLKDPKPYESIINQNLSIYYKRLGNFYLDKKRNAEALKSYKKSLELDDNQKLLKVILKAHKVSPALARKIVSKKRSYSQEKDRIDSDWTLIDKPDLPIKGAK